MVKYLLSAALLIAAFACGDDGSGGDHVFGQYAGMFECRDFDADVATLVIEDDASTLSFIPSAGGNASATISDLVVSGTTVSFGAVFVDVVGEDPELTFSFVLSVEDDGVRLDGDGTLNTGAGDAQACDATFTRPSTQ